MDILTYFYRLSWKKITGIATLLLLIISVPVSLQIANNATRTQTEAALIHPSAQPITTKFETPAGPPKIYLVDHFFGKTGDAVLIHGENLGGLHPQSSIILSGQRIPQENLVSWTGSYIEFKVPENAKSGLVEINILGQKTNWPGMFFVINNSTNAELNLIKDKNNANVAYLIPTNTSPAKELLIWFLIINADGELKFTPASGVTLSQNAFKLPLGKVYELKLSLNNPATENLLTIEKGADQTVGIARAELTTADNQIIPVKVNPLYVSF